MQKLKVIVGSTREGRNADRVAPWVAERAGAHGTFDVEVLDLREWKLPHFQENLQTLGNPADPTYSEPIVRRWNDVVKDGDAFLIVTAEYNHGIPGELKNALDSVFVSFGLRHKPVAFVGYSNSITGGARSVEQLIQVLINFDAVPLRQSVLVGNVESAFATDAPADTATEAAMDVMLDDLAWWSDLLTNARTTQLSPGMIRFRQALAART